MTGLRGLRPGGALGAAMEPAPEERDDVRDIGAGVGAAPAAMEPAPEERDDDGRMLAAERRDSGRNGARS